MESNGGIIARRDPALERYVVSVRKFERNAAHSTVVD
jgi:hypothetical protein